MFTQSQSRAKTAKYLRLKEFVFVYKELKKRGGKISPVDKEKKVS